MTAQAFLGTLQQLGVEVIAAGERLRYRAPAGLLTPALREEMARHKQEILALLRQSETKRPAQQSSASDSYSLSPAQERLWFMEQLVPDTSLYNEAIVLRLSGTLYLPALAESFNELVRRHEALRTQFVVVEGQPCQRTLPELRLALGLVDLSSLPAEARAEAARELAREQAGKPFNLTQPPLLRLGLIALGPEEHLLVLTLHHIICDGWSRGILIRELSRLYAAYCRGVAADLSEPDLQYSDFAQWQKERISRGELDHERLYWRQQLGDSPPAVNLPTDRPRPPSPSYRGGNCRLELSPELSQRVRELSRANGVTTYMTLLAVWQVLMGRYCGQEELIVGTVAANRTRAELEKIVGLIVNTLPIKGDLAGNPRFKEFLGRVKDAALGAYKHQELPYDHLVAELAAGRDLSRREIIELMFVMEQSLAGPLELTGLAVSEEPVETGMAKYDLMMVWRENAGRFQGRIEYNGDLFDEPRIRRMAESYQKLVAEVVAEPDQRILDLPLLTEPELRLLAEWNETAVEYGGTEKVHRMFEQQAARTPDAIAVVYGDAYLTYGELNGRANQLADYLRGLGVGPEALVGLCVERSAEMAVGVLAILKAGSAYLPLDPTYPKDRLRFMIADAGLSVLLTERHLVERLPSHSAMVLCIDSFAELTGGRGRDNLADIALADTPAYVMYTSGSTGKPKGVCMPHGALRNLILWHTSTVVSKARTLQFASLSFDVSFYEMFATWVAGGTLIIAQDELRIDMVRLAAFITNHRIEKVVLPVVVLQQLAEEHSFRRQPPLSLRTAITTGEQLQITRPIARLFSGSKLCSLHNHYGPSESHVVTSYSLAGQPDSWPTHPAVGKPIANTQIYVLDQRLNPVPLSTVGELHIGGVALARGYLNRPELTAERFIPNPLAEQPGQRLYKTGDLARHLEDGNVEFLGRADHQVKIRGFRVEPGEVESVLGQHPAVCEAIVVTREDAPGCKRLIAYVAANRKRKLTAGELSDFLRERLPDYMVPSAYTIMERLPLTVNGKIDRAALSLSCPPMLEPAEELIPARTPAEELVTRIWREVLGVEHLGINSNFFRLGGHSLLATQVILRLRDIFCIDVPVRSMFETPTVNGIVKVMSMIWGGREIVEEIAWTFLQVEQLSDEQVSQFLAQRGLPLQARGQANVPDCHRSNGAGQLSYVGEPLMLSDVES